MENLKEETLTLHIEISKDMGVLIDELVKHITLCLTEILVSKSPMDELAKEACRKART